MGFNFNFFETMTKFRQFQQLLQNSGKDPEQLLEQELKRRNVSPDQLRDLVEQAKQMQKLFNVRL